MVLFLARLVSRILQNSVEASLTHQDRATNSPPSPTSQDLAIGNSNQTGSPGGQRLGICSFVSTRGRLLNLSWKGSARPTLQGILRTEAPAPQVSNYA